jgi:Zn finger protein HypA/HybF involved in hydrogenase expression
MYDLLSLKLKCPVCSASLLDHQRLVDNEPSIRLKIKIGENKGTINLSSIYGSYNYIADIEIRKDEIAEFNCPHCEAQITSDQHCLTCDAPTIPLYLDMGGKVSFCSRSGCKNHKVEFEDLSIALNKLYQEYGFGGKAPKREIAIEKTESKEVKDEAENKEVIESGAFLQAYCPKCKKSLIEDEMLKVKITNGQTGYLLLSPYLNVFTNKSTIYLPEDKVVRDLQCFHCDATLIEKEKQCEKCGSPVAKISVSARTKLLDFYMCTKKGCRWHGLSKEDFYDIRLEDSLEW